MNKQNLRSKWVMCWMAVMALLLSAPLVALGATLSLNPSSGSYPVGATFQVEIRADSQGEALVVADAIVRYNPALLELASIDTSGSSFTYGFGLSNFPIRVIDQAAGEGQVVIGLPTPGVNGSSLLAATLTFRALAASSGAAVSFYYVAAGASGDSNLVRDDGLGTDRLSGVSGGVYALTSVTPPPTIGLNPPSFAFNGTAGGANPPSQTLNISNTGGGTITWTLTSNSAWLSGNPVGGTAPATVDVSVISSGLAAGTYNGALTVSAIGATNSPQTVPVTLSLASPASCAGTGRYRWAGKVVTGRTGIAGVTLTLAGPNGCTTTTVTDAYGKYKFSKLGEGTYTVTPAKAGCAFTPGSSTQAIAGSSVKAKFTGSCP